LSQGYGKSTSILWKGKPWIVPGVAVRTVVILVIAAVVSWLELTYDFASRIFPKPPLSNLQIVLWVDFVFLLIWIFSQVHLLVLRASNTYVLRQDSLELRFGILTAKSEMISPSGFSDLEVVRSVSNRILNSGNIIIRTQSEDEKGLVMLMVHDPLNVAAQIREVMSRPIVRIEGQGQIGPKK
jgi:uncharacterized membrane protein YdbT with pleckstrin-like domain